MTALPNLLADVQQLCSQPLDEVELWTAPDSLTRLPIDAILGLGILDWTDQAAINHRRGGRPAERLARRRLFRRLALAAHSGADPRSVHLQAKCPTCGARTHGRPHVVRPHGRFISTAATGDNYVVAIAREPVGIDVERPSRLAGFSDATFRSMIPSWVVIEQQCPPKTDHTSMWTAVEAITKGLGTGLTTGRHEMETAGRMWQVHWLPRDRDLQVAIATRPRSSAG